MKKMLLAFLVTMAAFVAQAAALNWQSWGYTNDGSLDSDWISGGQGYLIQVTDTDVFNVAVVGGNLAITGGDIVDSAAFDAGTVAGTWNDTTALVDGTTYHFAILMTTNGVSMDALPTEGYYGVDMNGDTAGTFYEVTWDAEEGGVFAADDNFGGAAMVQTVPEPTVLALLALGVAGLALKRKVA